MELNTKSNNPHETVFPFLIAASAAKKSETSKFVREASFLGPQIMRGDNVKTTLIATEKKEDNSPSLAQHIAGPEAFLIKIPKKSAQSSTTSPLSASLLSSTIFSAPTSTTAATENSTPIPSTSNAVPESSPFSNFIKGSITKLNTNPATNNFIKGGSTNIKRKIGTLDTVSESEDESEASAGSESSNDEAFEDDDDDTIIRRRRVSSGSSKKSKTELVCGYCHRSSDTLFKRGLRIQECNLQWYKDYAEHTGEPDKEIHVGPLCDTCYVNCYYWRKKQGHVKERSSKKKLKKQGKTQNRNAKGKIQVSKRMKFSEEETQLLDKILSDIYDAKDGIDSIDFETVSKQYFAKYSDIGRSEKTLKQKFYNMSKMITRRKRGENVKQEEDEYNDSENDNDLDLNFESEEDTSVNSTTPSKQNLNQSTMSLRISSLFLSPKSENDSFSTSERKVLVEWMKSGVKLAPKVFQLFLENQDKPVGTEMSLVQYMMVTPLNRAELDIYCKILST